MLKFKLDESNWFNETSPSNIFPSCESRDKCVSCMSMQVDLKNILPMLAVHKSTPSS